MRTLDNVSQVLAGGRHRKAVRLEAHPLEPKNPNGLHEKLHKFTVNAMENTLVTRSLT